MKFTQRLAYYLGGFAIGLVILFFFLNGKKTSCDYTPNARTLKNIRLKKRSFSQLALNQFTEFKIDTNRIEVFLNEGEVLFNKSNTALDSCKHYVVEAIVQESLYQITVENCEHTAQILQLNQINKN